jgi:large subunit ribosomal protein L21
MMKYAIVESGGKQFKAVEGGTIEVDRLPVETGTNIKLEQVLMLADGENFTVGTPLIKNSPVWTTVLEHFKGPKVTIFNYSPKKRIRVKIGHRQNYTRLLVDQIGGTELVKKEPVIIEKAVEVGAAKLATKEKPEASTSKRKAGKPEKPSPKTKASTSKAKPATSGKKPTVKATAKPVSKKGTPAKAKTKAASKVKTASKVKAAPKKPAAK